MDQNGFPQTFISSDSSINVDVKGPLTTFGELLTSENTPILQSSFQYDFLSFYKSVNTDV